MKENVLSRKYFLYRHRFGIGYTILLLLFAGLLFFLPLISPNGLSQAEMDSTVTSAQLSMESISNGEIIDLPYHLLQKVSVELIGLTPYAIKLPSMIIGLILGILLILLLNRWFKNNVAILASILTVLSTPFLYLAGSGTPLIMIVFWPTLLLWLGSKIQGEQKPRISYCFYFIFAMILSIFTPYIMYLVVIIGIYVLLHPHLRWAVKNLPRIPFIIACMIGAAGVGLMTYTILRNPATGTELLFMDEFSAHKFLENLERGFLPFISWSGNVESTLLSPMIGLASIALALTGLISTAKGFFASRNSIATMILLFNLLITGMNPDMAILVLLPLSILTAHGIRYIVDQWYGLFPENPYARFFGILPIGLFIGVMVVSSSLHYIYGYRYNPAVANEFNNDLELIYESIPDGTTMIASDEKMYDFYKIIEAKTEYKIVRSRRETKETEVASLRKLENANGYSLEKIIVSPKSYDADRIYLYKKM
ncbi:MAG: glycosyltransferase family 39 protein [Candidatus Saccharibacteria bacterium]|nr:glycosyltransferase family 39 protein [Candidatus Saccharibacteria bacterium]